MFSLLCITWRGISLGLDQILQPKPMLWSGEWALTSCYSLGAPGEGKFKPSAMEHFDNESFLGRFEDGECQSPSARGWNGRRNDHCRVWLSLFAQCSANGLFPGWLYWRSEDGPIPEGPMLIFHEQGSLVESSGGVHIVEHIAPS